jgi:penicillin-binding protein-related factor A (putative recombinase)
VINPALRRLAASRAKKSGNVFEQWLSAFVFQPLQVAGVVARFDKLEPQMQAVTIAGERRFIPVKGSGGDWILLMAGGGYTVVESKSTRDERFYFEQIPEHQRAHLQTAVASGAGAFLALRFELAAACFLVPWQSVPWERARTALSVRADLLSPWRVENWTGARDILNYTRGARK